MAQATNKKILTVKDLEREIADLRNGLSAQTESFVRLSSYNLELKQSKSDLERDNMRFFIQLEEEREEHLKTRRALLELISKIPTST